MKFLRLPKMPKLKMPRVRKDPAPRKLQARMRAADPTMVDSYDDEEPQTKLTSAFIVVLILHVVAVGGIYAFNQIKASRRGVDAAPVAPQTAPKESTKAASAQPEKVARTEPAVAPVSHPVAPVASIQPTSKQRVYNVKPGDNLVSIAKAFSVPVADLKSANGLSNDMIRPGQVLNLPTARPAATTAPAVEPTATAAKPADTADAKPQYRTYTVKQGDRLVFIAKKLNVTQEDLIALNKIKDTTKLQIGQTLKVPAKK